MVTSLELAQAQKFPVPSALYCGQRASAGRTCMTRRRVVALLQSLESSRQRMMYSRCSILLRTMFSTCLALCCSAALRRPGAAEISPALARKRLEYKHVVEKPRNDTDG